MTDNQDWIRILYGFKQKCGPSSNRGEGGGKTLFTGKKLSFMVSQLCEE